MKSIYVLCFFLFIISCRQTEIDPQPLEIPFQTTCLLSKTQHFYEAPNKSLQLDYVETYQYDSLKRITEYAFSYKGGSDTLRYEYSFKDVYRYNSSGFLVEIITNGLYYNGNAKYYGNKPSPIAPITGKTTFTYQNGLLVKEEKYQKINAEFVVEMINPRTDRKFYEYDSQGKLTKYRNETAYENGVSYFLSNDKIIKSETDWYETSTQKFIINDIFTQWGLLTQHNFPKVYYQNGRYKNRTTEIGDYEKYAYDSYGRRVKFEKYRQEYTGNIGSITVSDNAFLVNITEFQYEDTRLPITTLPLPKGHPKVPDFEGNKTYNLRSRNLNFRKVISGYTPDIYSISTYSYDYNADKLPTNLIITNNSNDDKGNSYATSKERYNYEYLGCK